MYILGAIRQSIAHNSNGGMELVSHDLYRGLVSLGCEVEVLTTSLNHNGKEISELYIDGVKYIFIKKALSGVYSQELHSGVQLYLKSLMDRDKRPLVIHSVSGAAASVTKNIYKIPVIATWHGTNIEQELDKIMSYVYLDHKTLLPSHFENLLLGICNNKKLQTDFQSFDGHIAISSFMKECILSYGVDQKNVTVITNALPDIFFKEFKPLDGFKKPQNKVLLGLVGRPIPMKGYRFFREVVEKLNPGKFELMVVGGGQEALQYFKDCKIKVHFLSVKRDQMPSVYALMDIYINPTFRYSGFDLTVQEALISGAIVLNSDVKPYRNYYDELQIKFKESSPFFIFKVGDVDSCVNAINRICVKGAKNQYKSYFMQNFGLQDMVDLYIKFFNDLNKKISE